MWDMTAGHFYKPWSGVAYLPGERGEYDLTAHIIFALKAELIAMGRTANQGLLLPEQVWDQPSTPKFKILLLCELTTNRRNAKKVG